MTATTVFPLVPTPEGTIQNAAPSNENIVRLMALMAPAIDFSDAAPGGTPAEGDQYVIRTTWGGFAVGNFVRMTNGAWREFAVWNGLHKKINGQRYVRLGNGWHQVADWVDVPSSASATGTPGQIAYDPDTLYFYACVATNTWKRTLMESSVSPTPSPPPVDPATVLLHCNASPIADDSGHGYTITTYAGAAMQTTTFKFGPGALGLNGGFIVASHNDLKPTNIPFTFDAWVFITDLSGQQFIYDNRSPGGQCVYQTDGRLHFYDGASGIDLAFSGDLLTANTWHHIMFAVDIDGGTGVGTGYLFQDGVLGGTQSPTASTWTNPRWTIGAAQYTPEGVNVLKGDMDEIRIVMGQCMHKSSFTPRTTPYNV